MVRRKVASPLATHQKRKLRQSLLRRLTATCTNSLGFHSTSKRDRIRNHPRVPLRTTNGVNSRNGLLVFQLFYFSSCIILFSKQALSRAGIVVIVYQRNSTPSPVQSVCAPSLRRAGRSRRQLQCTLRRAYIVSLPKASPAATRETRFDPSVYYTFADESRRNQTPSPSLHLSTVSSVAA